ncbi:uncharacterized protein BDW43DRAFT_316244 [Aspergillus alliaceus]|uniref:uncharacterized protein n=1 Tax=Petromyces alliaceus TaxID=209559 RepID=UPI0012A6C51E|nr:uncharacterized protein BDW43DRAFT_316244 [Aspergillus alliaceus]KAB8228037.1 hypothetical protein BDW43DRAFT_316244 [Aspergillus alliaceus]
MPGRHRPALKPTGTDGVSGELERCRLDACGEEVDPTFSCPAITMDMHTFAVGSKHSTTPDLLGEGCTITKMAMSWTEEEIAERRRIVRFLSLDRGIDHIHISMLPVPVYQDMPESVYVSCIFWPALDECFITSADIIHLLQFLLRRNISHPEWSQALRSLARFRPQLITKSQRKLPICSNGSGLKDLRALAIRKDAKIFRWGDLELVIITILNKYALSTSVVALVSDHAS